MKKKAERKFLYHNICSKNLGNTVKQLNIAQGKTTESIYIAKYLCISLHWVWFDCVLKSKDVCGAAIQYWWYSTPMYNVTYSQWWSKSLSSCFLNFHGAKALMYDELSKKKRYAQQRSSLFLRKGLLFCPASLLILGRSSYVMALIFLQKFFIFFISLLWNFRYFSDILVYYDQKL